MTSYCHRCNATLDDDLTLSCPECASDPPAHGWPRDARLGRLVAGGQYRVLRRLGAGGFGSVYLVETVVGGLRRALKVLNAEWAADEEMRERFVNEALVLEQVNHPNVARCYAAGTLDDERALYLLLELVEGVPLGALVGPGRPVGPARAVNLAKQVASGLLVAHANGVLHRDLKPANILVVGAGTSAEQAKLIDFGIAKSLGRATGVSRSMLGTPGFMAPEQLASGEPLDQRVDLWQLGATLFTMLTGEAPYASGPAEGETLDARHAAHAEAGPLPSTVNPALASHPSLDRLVGRLLATDRERRPRSAAQVTEELARLEHQLAPGAEEPSAMALLEALCAAPSAGAWSALCRYLSDLTDGQGPLVTAAETLVAEWPDGIRRAATGWWETVKRGREHALWPLARALDLSGRALGDEGVRELAGCAALRTITDLALADNEIGNVGCAALAASSNLARLERLDLADNRISSEGAAALAGGRALSALRVLVLAGNGIGPAGGAAIAEAGLSLRALDLADNDLQAAGARALASSAALDALERLDLRGNGLGSDGVGALAVSRTLARLVDLDLGHNGIGPSGAAALALSPNVGRLRSLSLAQNTLGVQGIELLLASNRFEALERLDVSSNEFGPTGAMVLASSPFARRLKALHLGDNGLGDAGLAALLGAHHLSGLRRLGVAQNGLTAAGVALLAGAPPELEALDLSANPLGEAGGRALAGALAKTRVSELAARGCGLGGDGVSELLRAAGGRLTSLDVGANGLDAAGTAALAGTPEASALLRLDLSGNPLGAPGVEALTRAPAAKGLRDLALDACGLADADAPALVRALDALPTLQTLGLRDNGLGPATASALAASPLSARLGRLELAHNRLGDAGAEALARGRTWHVLHELGLERNDIGLGAAATLLASPGMALLHRVDLARNALAGQLDLHSLPRAAVARLEASFADLSAHGADFAERFYRLLFSRYPAVKPLFAHVSMKRQQQHLLSTLAMVIEHLRAPDAVAHALAELGARHVGYGVYASHYQAVSGTMLDAIRQTLGHAWSEDVERAWHDGLEAVTAVMLRAHRDAMPARHAAPVDPGEAPTGRPAPAR